jgi:hypothetical protein
MVHSGFIHRDHIVFDDGSQRIYPEGQVLHPGYLRVCNFLLQPTQLLQQIRPVRSYEVHT